MSGWLKLGAYFQRHVRIAHPTCWLVVPEFHRIVVCETALGCQTSQDNDYHQAFWSFLEPCNSRFHVHDSCFLYSFTVHIPKFCIILAYFLIYNCSTALNKTLSLPIIIEATPYPWPLHFLIGKPHLYWKYLIPVRIVDESVRGTLSIPICSS